MKAKFVFISLSFLLYSSTMKADSQANTQCDMENGLKNGIQEERKEVKFNILDRMKYYKVPGVSIAIIDNGKITCAKAYNISIEKTVTPQTLFQAASISKSIAAIVALSLFEKYKISLDKNVNEILKTWKVPDNQYTINEKVTLRRLLSHTSGLTVHGFDGYSSSLTEKELPDTIQILNGKNPANNPRVEPVTIPGKVFSYSGGGYIVAEKILEDITDEKFSDLASLIVFKPLNMKSSTYKLIWPNSSPNNIAVGHAQNGQVIPGNWNIYPETAAAGLWTTPSDLARFIIDIQNTFSGISNNIVSNAIIKKMLTKQPNSYNGLGFRINKLNPDVTEFSHSGYNEGYIAYFVGFTKIGKGAVIMTNSENGGMLFPEILRSIADAYHWPQDYTNQYKIVKVATVDPAMYYKFAGKFKVNASDSSHPDIILTLFTKNNKLFIRLPYPEPASEKIEFELLPESDRAFFTVEGDFEIKFTQGNSDDLMMNDMKAHRVLN
jgi:CubicO group peptidase (beta-lactamase class C family)